MHPENTNELWIQMRTSRVRLRPDGIIQVEIKPDVQQGPEDAKQNLAQVFTYCQNGKRSLLVDLRWARQLDAETRHIYSGKDLENSISSLAMVTNLDLFSTTMVNIYMKVVKLSIPTKLFTDFNKALAWVDSNR